MTNIITCPKCGILTIWEEFDHHVCLEQKETYQIKGDMLYYFDGKKWHNERLPTRKNNQSKRPSSRQNRILGSVVSRGVFFGC